MTAYILHRIFNSFIIIIALCFVIPASTAQVGINTDPPAVGTLLDVRSDSNNTGVLLPHADIPNLSTLSPFPVGTQIGTLVYNTNAASGIGYYFWDGLVWKRFNASFGQMAKYNNPESAVTGQNLNQIATVEIVGDVEFNDNVALFQPVGNTGIRVNEPGVYQVTIALSLVGTFGNTATLSQNERAEIDARIHIDGNPIGPLYRSTEMNITAATGDLDYGSVTFTQPVIITTAGQLVTVETNRSSGMNRGIVRLRSTGSSTILIQKLI